MRRHLDLHPHAQIALAVALQIFHPAALQPEQRAGLRAGGNPDGGPAFQGGHLDFGPERGLHKTDGNFADQVVALAGKDLVMFDAQKDVQIAGRARRETPPRRCLGNAGANRPRRRPECGV